MVSAEFQCVNYLHVGACIVMEQVTRRIQPNYAGLNGFI